MEDRLNRAYASACKYCAYQERAPSQVREKLIKWGYSDEDCDVVIFQLKQEKFIDETRFARAFCHDKFEFNQWGRIKIRMELGRYNLPSNLVEDALFAIPEDKYEKVAMHLIQKKWDTLNSKSQDDFKNRPKVVKYLMGKGYEGELAWRLVKELGS